MRNKFFWIVFLLGVVAVFYLSWVAQPKLSSLWFMPSWLGRWTDAGGNENLRTAVPFLFLGGFSGLWLSLTNKPFRHWVIGFAFLILVATIAELGQLFLSQRTCDVGDILWASAGSFTGMLSMSLSKIRININKKAMPDYASKLSGVSGV